MAIDEQMMGFQGALGMKLCISYKQEGDGFQCDAICYHGYTSSFWFCYGPPTDLELEMKDLALSPMAAWVIWLAQCLPNKWTWVYMDNLFTLLKLFTALHREHSLVHGVVWAQGMECQIP